MAQGKMRDPRRETHWRRVVRRQQRSGLTIREFCRKSKLPDSAFYFWRRELERRQAEVRQAEHVSGGSAGRSAAKPAASAKPEEQRRRRNRAAQAADSATGPAFVPVRVAESPVGPVTHDAPARPAGRVEIELSGGRRVHVIAPVDRAALADVLAVLSLDWDARGGEGRPC